MTPPMVLRRTTSRRDVCAARFVRRAPRLWRTRLCALLVAAVALSAFGPSPAAAQSASEALAQGRAALTSGDFAAAQSFFAAATRAEPENRQAQLGLAIAYDKVERFEEAIRIYDRLIEERPEDRTALFYRGVTRYKLGALDDAVADFRQAIAQGARFAVAHLRLGDAFYAQGGFANAIIAYERAVSAPDAPAAAFRALGNAHYALGAWRSAIDAYSDALRSDPRDGRAALHRGWAHERAGDVEAAAADFTRAIEVLGGVDPAVSVARGDLFRRFGYPRAAIADYQRAVELDPTDQGALYGAAAALLLDGRTASARTILDQLIEQLSPEDSRSAAALRLRADALLRLGEARAAEADLSLSLKLEPDHMAAHYNRGLARAAFGDLAGALDDMRSAGQLSPGDPEARYGHLRAAIAAGLQEETGATSAAAEILPNAGAARAASLLAFGRTEAALTEVNAHLAETGASRRALQVKMRALMRLARYEEAYAFARGLVGREPRRALYHVFEAEALIALGRADAARVALQRANALGASPARIARLAGGAWLADETPAALQQAADALDAAVDLSNQSPEALALRAATRLRLGELDLALADLDSAVAAEPQNAAYRFQRAALHQQMDDCAAAIRDLDAGLSLSPGNAEARAARGACKFDQGRFLGGVTDYVVSWF